MQIDTDGLAARIDDLIDHLERPRDTTVLRVLESKAAAGDVAIAVTSGAMRACGGAAFAKHMAIERLFRDARARRAWAKGFLQAQERSRRLSKPYSDAGIKRS